MAGETILHIGYDSVLMQVREAALERHGYHVVSVKGNEAAMRIANDGADLVVVGALAKIAVAGDDSQRHRTVPASEPGVLGRYTERLSCRGTAFTCVV
jgi:CheY-like chemotaxis protein